MNTKAMKKVVHILSAIEAIAVFLRICFWDSRVLEVIFVVALCARIIVNLICQILDKRSDKESE